MLLNQIHCEDCLLTLTRLPHNCIDLCLTSPPYDKARTYHGISINIAKLTRALYRTVKHGGVVVWVVSDQSKAGDESGSSFRQALCFKKAGFKLLDTMIYLKPPRGACGNNRIYWQSFEYMFVFTKGRARTINLLRDRPNKESRSGDRGTKRLRNGQLKRVSRAGYAKFGRRTNVWQYAVGRGHSTKDEIAFQHPAIFPEALARDHILSWTNPKDLVYDPFMGSGTTAKMAMLTGRNYLGSEISSEYCQLAEQRLSAYRKK